MRRAVLFALAALACGPKAAMPLDDVIARVDWASTPRLVSPDAGSYAAAEEPPYDAAVGVLLRDKRHDGALAGTATTLALAAAEQQGGLSRWELREAAWRAGWPYPIQDARGWELGESVAPPRDLVAWIDAVPSDEPMSLVRARGREGDHWVGVHAKPAVQLGSLPRLATPGSTLVLPAVAGATWRATDGVGKLREGSLDDGATLLLSSAGEWLVQVVRGTEELARFPVYVGVRPSTEPLLRLTEPQAAPATSADAEQVARALLARVRDQYQRPRWTSSPMFDAAVARYVAEPTLGSAGVLAAVGFTGVRGIVWACSDVTVENCIDSWVWDLRRREALVGNAYDTYGLKAELDATGIHLTLLLADAEP